jgi:hypothetical protein
MQSRFKFESQGKNASQYMRESQMKNAVRPSQYKPESQMESASQYKCEIQTESAVIPAVDSVKPNCLVR